MNIYLWHFGRSFPLASKLLKTTTPHSKCFQMCARHSFVCTALSVFPASSMQYSTSTMRMVFFGLFVTSIFERIYTASAAGRKWINPIVDHKWWIRNGNYCRAHQTTGCAERKMKGAKNMTKQLTINTIFCVCLIRRKDSDRRRHTEKVKWLATSRNSVAPVAMLSLTKFAFFGAAWRSHVCQFCSVNSCETSCSFYRFFFTL